MKKLIPFGCVLLAATVIYFVTYDPQTKMALVCDKTENCRDLYGVPSIGIRMGAIGFWSVGRAKDPSGFCRNGCTVKTVYDQIGNNDATQSNPLFRPMFAELK